MPTYGLGSGGRVRNFAGIIGVRAGQAHFLLIVAARLEGGDVHQVGEVGAGEAGRGACDALEVGVIVEGHRLGVQLEHLLAAGDVGKWDGHARVEAARPDERAVERLGEVGGGEDDDARVLLETIHLDEQLVERHLHRLPSGKAIREGCIRGRLRQGREAFREGNESGPSGSPLG